VKRYENRRLLRLKIEHPTSGASRVLISEVLRWNLLGRQTTIKVKTEGKQGKRLKKKRKGNTRKLYR